MPATRLQCPDADATTAAGVRLITVDRPGYGWSDPKPGSSLLGWADDYADLHTQLDLPPCPVMGWSGGGPYALACAFRLPAIVTSVGVAGSVGPITEVPGSFSEEARRLSRLLPDDPQGVLDETVKKWQGFADDPTSLFDGWFEASDQPPSPDARLFARPDVREAMTEWVRDAARQARPAWSPTRWRSCSRGGSRSPRSGAMRRSGWGTRNRPTATNRTSSPPRSQDRPT